MMVTNRVDPENPLPLYYQVYRSLIERIEAGEFSDGTPLPPERQLAEDYSVSRITITKALAELKREGRLKGQVGRGTFVTQPSIQSTKSGIKRTLNVVSFICRLISHPYMGMIMSGIAHIAEQHTYYLQVISSYENQGQYPELQDLATAVGSSARGAIIYLGGGDAYRMLCASLQEQGIPIVLVERHHPSIIADRVIFNDEEAAYTLTKNLIEQGHTRIAVAVPQFDITNSTIRERLIGYRHALKEFDLPYDEDLVWMDLDVAYYLAEDPNEIREATYRRLWKQIARDKVTAVLALNPDIANIIMQQPAPDEVSLTIATFGYVEPTPFTAYPTVVAVHPSEEIGRVSARLLFDRMSGAVTGAPVTVTVPMKILTHAIEDITA